MSMTDDADVKQILTDYSKSVISDSEKLVAITNESKEKAERAQNIEENFYDLEKAFKVTTGYDFEGYQIRLRTSAHQTKVLTAYPARSHLSVLPHKHH